MCGNLVQDVSADEEEALNKIASVGEYFYMEDGQLAISLTEEELQADFGFSPQQYKFLQKDVLDVANGKRVPVGSSGSAEPLVNCGGWYISNPDLTTGVAAALVTAATAGPDALAAALTGLASVVGGPIGTIIGGGVAVLGTAFFIDLSAKILGAVAQGKGICLSLTWAFPPLTSAIK